MIYPISGTVLSTEDSAGHKNRQKNICPCGRQTIIKTKSMLVEGTKKKKIEKNGLRWVL